VSTPDPEIITDAELEHLKRLSRLAMSPEDTARVKQDLNKVLGYFQVLQRLDTAGLPEMARPVALVNVLRDDEPTPGLSQAEALAVGVQTEEGFFKVPRTVE
jgi:aspartyl-tRNA(Asn)/glutamyl-tRNA(Gln) amidotransferase subunit C